MVSTSNYAKGIIGLSLTDLYREDLRLTTMREHCERLPATFNPMLELVDGQLAALESEIQRRYRQS